ncbi:MAG: histidinol-phosphatase [Verrucomicrobiota bacterium]
MTHEPHAAFLRELAEASARVILPYYGARDMGLELKSDDSPVTLADRGAEQVMREMITRRFPDHGIIGEEFGTERGGAEFVWVLDPVDGTKSFVLGVPLFGTLIGLMHRGRPLLGCIHQPVLRQLMIGDGKVTTLNDQPVRVRPCAKLSEATLLTTDPLHPAKYQNGAGFDALTREVRLYRGFGDCYGYLLLCCGRVDVMVDPIVNPWDLLPLVPLLEGAGATVTDWQGRPANHAGATSAVASAPELHAEVLRRLNS